MKLLEWLLSRIGLARCFNCRSWVARPMLLCPLCELSAEKAVLESMLEEATPGSRERIVLVGEICRLHVALRVMRMGGNW